MRRLLTVFCLLAVLSLPGVAAGQSLDEIVEDAETPDREETEEGASAGDEHPDDEEDGSRDGGDDELEQIGPPIYGTEGRFGTHETRWGLVVGPTLDFVTAENDALQEAGDPVIRYAIGVHGEYIYQGIVGVTLEALFHRRGWSTEGTARGREVDLTHGISYFDIPVMLRLSIPGNDRLVPKLLIGPHTSLFVDGKRDGQPDDVFYVDADQDDDIADEDVNNVQFGFTVGLGLELFVPPGTVTFGARYMHNFTEVFERPVGGQNVEHRTFLAMLGFLF